VDDPLPFFSRLWLAITAWFRIVFDGAFAARVARLNAPGVELAASTGEAEEDEAAPADDDDVATRHAGNAAAASSSPPVRVSAAADGALQLLGLLQREGRLIDFVQQDIATFADADVGAAARVVHAGCRRALAAHLELKSVRAEAEGTRVSIGAAEIGGVKLVGNVTGAAPYRGVLRHRGWQVESLRLPTIVGEQDLAVVAKAEVEL
jgi:hypothetical protein